MYILTFYVCKYVTTLFKMNYELSYNVGVCLRIILQIISSMYNKYRRRITFQNTIYFKHLLYNIIKGIHSGNLFVKVIAIRASYQLNT